MESEKKETNKKLFFPGNMKQSSSILHFQEFYLTVECVDDQGP